jgi:hypothetical protein
MEERKMTAVEFLFMKLKPANWPEHVYKKYFKEVFDQAKQMEKKQICEAFRMGDVEGCVDFDFNKLDEDYYNQTYKNK